MTDVNMANRQCCDLDIREFASNKPFMFADFCNTTTAGFTGDSVYAMKKGSKAIAFPNPIDSTITIEFQCHPFKVYSLLSDGTISSEAVLPVRKEVKCTTAGTLTIPDVVAVENTVYVYNSGDFGGEEIKGTATNTTGVSFTATTDTDVEVDSTYLVCFLEKKTTGVQRVEFNNKKNIRDYRITMETLDKDANGLYYPARITAYKVTPKRQFEAKFASDGEPATITMTFDALEDNEGNILDMVEITDTTL